jgi:hypothetical protein
MTTRYVDNGSGAKLNQSANCVSLPAALATTTAIKTTGALTYGFSTSAKGQALIDMVVAMRAALVTAGIAV